MHEQPSEPTMRPATLADATTVARIWHEGWLDGHLGHVPDRLRERRTQESFQERSRSRVADTLVAEVEGAVVGFVMVVDDEVEQVYVDRRRRGSAVAPTLLVAAERAVVDHGHARAWLAVATGNARARRFYERHGWRDDGRFENLAQTDEGAVPVDCHRYVKDVSSA